MKNWIPNYKINILEVRRYPNWKSFRTDLRQVFGLLYHTVDGRDVGEYIEANGSEYENLSEDAYDLISTVTDVEKLQEVKERHRTQEGGINMSNAIQEMLDKREARARLEAKAEGKAEGMAEGKAAGEARVTLVIRFLLDHSREDEIRKALDDREYRNKIYDEIDS